MTIINTTAADLYGDLWQEIADKVAMLEDLKKQLAGIAKEDVTQAPVQLIGNKWKVEFSKPATENKLKIDPETFLKETQLFEAVSISAPKAKGALSEADFEKYFYPVSGSRRIGKVVPVGKVVSKSEIAA